MTGMQYTAPILTVYMYVPYTQASGGPKESNATSPKSVVQIEKELQYSAAETDQFLIRRLYMSRWLRSEKKVF